MYVNPADVQPYLTIAGQYAFADHMFQANQGPSFPAHQFILSGTSAPTATSNLFAAENGPDNGGCISAHTVTIRLIDPSGSETSNPPIYPCFEHATLTDLLDAANISWPYYAPSAGSIWTAPDAIQHMCGPNATPPNATACVGADWTGATPRVVVGQTQVLADIASGQLSQVTWVIPDGQDSDHASLNDGCGPSWVTSIVNAIGSSPYWPNTTIIYHPRLGRLGRLVRPRFAAATVVGLRAVGLRICVRIPGAHDRDVALRQASLHLPCQS